MRKQIKVMWAVIGMAVFPFVSSAYTILETTYPFEDAAYQVAKRLNADAKVTSAIKNIAVAKIFVKEGTVSIGAAENESIIFETALAAVPGKLNFVLHTSHNEDWKELDEIFRQARDMFSWDPKTTPRLKKLKLCDGILVAHVIAFVNDEKTDTLTMRMALRLIQVATGEEIWAGVIEGRHSNGGPDNEQVSLNWRRALESCAADAVKKLPQNLDGYGLLLLPIEGKTGKAMKQVFLNALTAAGKQEKIQVYDLPNGNAQDRMLAKFLSERAASAGVDDEYVKRGLGRLVLTKKLPAKLALMSGMVSVVNENPQFALTKDGLPADFIGGTVAKAAEARKSYEIVTDFKFRDVSDSFRLIGSVGARGIYAPQAVERSCFEKAAAFLDRLFAFAETDSVSRVVKITIAVLVLAVLLGFIRKIIVGASRPR